jgi:formate/nitrite transporter FocA (FNT family)
VSLDYADAARPIKRGRRAERRGKAIQKFISSMLAKAASDLITAWYLMLAVGVAHAEWLHKLPTIGYWWALLLVVLVRPLFTSTATKSDD